MSHTSTPWATATGDETKIVYRPSPYAYDRQVVAEGLSPSDARHIVACVNACAGMNDPAADIARLREANAEMLGALKSLSDRFLPSDSFEECWLADIRRIITKAEDKP